MPKVSLAHLEARRRGILRAAARCISRQGLRATTVKDICRAANLSPGAVYRYFESKEEIVEALAEQGRERILEFVRGLPLEGPAPAALARVLTALLEEAERPEALEGIRLDAILWGEALEGGRLNRLFRRDDERLIEHLAGIAQRGRERGEIDPRAEPRALARALLALFEGLVLQKARDPQLDLGETTAAVTALVERLARSESSPR